MAPSQRDTEAGTDAEVRFADPNQPLSPAAQEALDRRSLEEHELAIAAALRRR
ncbi:MAG: hypothetical protein ACE367_20600 [Acidimicrobiales bacterium]|jgi:hypothetical protein